MKKYLLIVAVISFSIPVLWTVIDLLLSVQLMPVQTDERLAIGAGLSIFGLIVASVGVENRWLK